MKRVFVFLVLGPLFFAAYILRDKKQNSTQAESHAAGHLSLSEARRNFSTKLIRHEAEHEPVPPPPALFRTVHYQTALGPMAAYLSQPAKDGQRHPAIVWVVGGFGNDIGDTPWEDQSPDNDQSASAFWKAGIVTLYPSFRGGNDNPGYNDSFFGEW